MFVVEWFDSAASLVRNYNLTYFLKDKTIELVPIYPRSTTSKTSAYSSSGASTRGFSLRIFLWGRSSMSTPGSSKSLILLISTPEANSRPKGESIPHYI